MRESEEKENDNSMETKPLQDFVVTVNNLPKKQFPEVTTAGGKFGLVKFLLFISSSNKHVAIFENFFRWEGEFVSRHAIKVLFGCILFTFIGLGGLPMLHTENNAIKLWIPQDSDFAVNYGWLWSTYPPEFRRHTIILHGDDVLTPEAVQKMYKIYKSIKAIETPEYKKTWSDSCFRRPVLKLSSDMFEPQERRKRDLFDDMNFDDEMESFGDEFEKEFEKPADYSINNYPSPYCEMVESLPTACFEETILELWAIAGEFSEESDSQIANITKSEIVEKVNNWGYSELFLTEKDFKPLLGGVTYGADNKTIIKARAVKMEWIGRMNTTAALLEGGSDTAGTGELLDSETAEFEQEMIRVLLEAKDIEPTNIQVEVNVMSSFGQIASATIMTDVTNLIIGFAIVFTYVNLMLGKFNMVEQRGFVSLMGLVSVGGSIFFSYGFCSYFGLAFGPLHNIIPFLLLGIGIDDMFVAVQCFQNLPPEVQDKSLHERMGEAMLRAGSAITITSLTDFLAFIIGGTTVLPALRSFCIYCAVGILVVYILQATWFFAWFSLDQRRVEAKRDGAFPCYVHKNYTPNQFSQRNILQSCFKSLGNVIVKPFVKASLILTTIGLLAVSIWGNIELRQEFNPIWFLPPESYLAQWHQYNSKFYPSSGEKVTVFMGDLKLPEELDKLDLMHKELDQSTDIISSVNSWYNGFVSYMENFPDDGPVLNMTENVFNSRLTQYLFSPTGSQYRFLFQYEEPIQCGKNAPKIQLSLMDFQHILMDGPKEQIPAMNRAKEIFNSKNFSGIVFPMANGYAAWETDEIISVELFRNIILAMLCIFLTTWILLFNFVACLQVVMCVVLTLVNVAGFMHFLGLTIDTVSSVYLIISIGLCVDYSAHIAHAFMMCPGPREERVKDALAKIGPAVLNGGFSTFLAFVLLGGSKSHVFQSFFKIFLLVVIFGLYNGLIILPIVLSFIGPRSYKESLKSSEKAKTTELANGDELQPIIKPGKIIEDNLQPIIKPGSNIKSFSELKDTETSIASAEEHLSDKLNGDKEVNNAHS